MSEKITVIDYQCGNLKSVEQALSHAGANVVVTSSPEEILSAHKLVLPGVGAFPVGMAHLHQLDLVEPLIEKANSGTPLLGICLGMQLLFAHSEEHGGAEGLSLIEGDVLRMVTQNPSIKLPHIGWNELELQKTDRLLKQNDYFYFVHSYMAMPTNKNVILASSVYEDIEFCAAVAMDNIWGMQFHPENSASQGISLLKSFVSL